MMESPTCLKCNSTNCFINQFTSKESKKVIDQHRSTRHYKKGEVIFREGDPVSGIYFIYHGQVKVYNTGTKGRTQIVRFANSGRILGHRGFGKSPFYPIGATTLEKSTICFIPKDIFIEALNTNPNLVLELLNFYADELRRVENKMRSLSQMTVKQKLAEALLTLREIFGVQKIDDEEYINVPLSRQDYADVVGASLEEVIRTLSLMQKEKLIRTNGKRIGIIHEEKYHDMLKDFSNLRIP